jgi:hypothetical protein
MSTKEIALATIKGLPEDSTWREIETHIRLLAEVNAGCEELQRGEGRIVSSESEFLTLARGDR